MSHGTPRYPRHLKGLYEGSVDFVEAGKAKKGSRTEYWDQGFGALLRLWPTGHKSRVLMYRRQAGGAKRRVVEGPNPLW